MIVQEDKVFMEFVDNFEKIESEFPPREDHILTENEQISLFLINKMMQKDALFASFMTLCTHIFTISATLGTPILRDIATRVLDIYDAVVFLKSVTDAPDRKKPL